MKSKLPPLFKSLFDVRLAAQAHVQSLLHAACTDANWIRALAESEKSNYTQSAIANALNVVPFENINLYVERNDCRVDLSIRWVRQYRVVERTIYIHIPLTALAGHVAFSSWRRREAVRLLAVASGELVDQELRARRHARRLASLRADVAASIKTQADAVEAKGNKKGGAS